MLIAEENGLPYQREPRWRHHVPCSTAKSWLLLTPGGKKTAVRNDSGAGQHQATRLKDVSTDTVPVSTTTSLLLHLYLPAPTLPIHRLRESVESKPWMGKARRVRTLGPSLIKGVDGRLGLSPLRLMQRRNRRWGHPRHRCRLRCRRRLACVRGNKAAAARGATRSR